MKRILAATIVATVAVAGFASVTVQKNRPVFESAPSFGVPPPPLCPPFCGTADTKVPVSKPSAPKP